MLKFIFDHLHSKSPFEETKVLDEDVQRALSWMKQRSADQVMAERERTVLHSVVVMGWHVCTLRAFDQVSEIEKQGAHMWASGECDAWLDGCKHGAREVVRSVNGPLLVMLARCIGFDDADAIEAFREGVRFFGLMEKCNLGPEVAFDAPMSVEGLRDDCIRSNTLLLEQLQESEHAAELLELTRADAALGRMSEPTTIDNVDLGTLRLCPRFPVVQGEHDDGRPKVRPVDHFSWSAPPAGTKKREGKKKMKENSINGRTSMTEKITYDHIDELIHAAKCIYTDLEVSHFMMMHRVMYQCCSHIAVFRWCQARGKQI